MVFTCTLILIMSLIAGWVLTARGWPGNWLMIAGATLQAWAVPATDRAAISWAVVIVAAIIAIAGEVSAFLPPVTAPKQVAEGRRGVSLSLGGAVFGGLAGLLIGAPIPLVGWVLGGLAGMFLGGGAGAVASQVQGDQQTPLWKRIPRALGALVVRSYRSAGRLTCGSFNALLLFAAVMS